MSDYQKQWRDDIDSYASELAKLWAERQRDGQPQEISRRVLYRNLRGLPSRRDLVKLAEIYTTIQRKLWPQLAEAGLLASVVPESLIAMANAFALKFLGKQAEPFAPPVTL